MLSQILKKEPKELAQFASDAYHEGVKDALQALLAYMPTFDLDMLNRISENLSERAFEAVKWRKDVEWIEGIDHSMSPSRHYVSMPIERYEELKAKAGE